MKAKGWHMVGNKNNFRHGLSRSAEYRIWRGIKSRCRNKSNPGYKDYGARGIFMCDAWFESFSMFIHDMGERPSASHSIERINNNDGYRKENCKWGTQSEQNRNTRKSVFITFRGESKAIPDWADATGIKAATIRNRIKNGWSVEQALTEPANEYKQGTKEL